MSEKKLIEQRLDEIAYKLDEIEEITDRLKRIEKLSNAAFKLAAAAASTSIRGIWSSELHKIKIGYRTDENWAKLLESLN